MKAQALFIVGDKFQEFAEGKDVLTLQQLQALMRLPSHLLNPTVLLLGQGASEEEVLSIVHAHKSSREVTPRFEVSDLMRVLDRAPVVTSHKKTPHNTLVGVPRRKSSSVYELALNLDERCELMSDHQTGQHVQGMLLVEAFRQSFLVVTDTFYPFGEGKNYFVINRMSFDFQNFMFPLPAHLDYRILEADVNTRRARYKVALAAIQHGELCATAEIGFTVYPREVIESKETELAAALTQKMLAARQRTVPTLDALAMPGVEPPARESEA